MEQTFFYLGMSDDDKAARFPDNPIPLPQLPRLQGDRSRRFVLPRMNEEEDHRHRQASELASFHTVANIHALRSQQQRQRSSGSSASQTDRDSSNCGSVGTDSHLSVGSHHDGSEGAASVGTHDSHSHDQVDAIVPSSWRTSGRSSSSSPSRPSPFSSTRGSGGDFVLGHSLSGRNNSGGALGVPENPDPEIQMQIQKLSHAMSLVWLLTACGVVLYAFGSVFFVSSAYFNPLHGGSGVKMGMLNATTTTTVDNGGGGHKQAAASAPLADPAFLVFYVASPVLVVAILYDVICRKHEGSVVRAKLPFLKWSRASTAFQLVPSRFRTTSSAMMNMTNGQLFFVAVVVATNVGVFCVALLAQFTRAMDGYDLDHNGDVLSATQMRGNAMKGIANAFGYCAIVSVAFLVMLTARPVTDFIVSDLFNLSYATGRVYFKRIGIWVCIASVFHVAFYARPYAVEGVLLKRLFFLSTTQEDAQDHATRERDVYLGWVIFYGEVASVAMAVMAFVTIFAQKIRESAYEVYQFANICGGICVLVCLHLHYDVLLWWLFPWLCLLGVQVVTCQANHRRPAKVVDFAPLRNGVTRLVLAASLSLSLEGGAQGGGGAGSGLAGKFVFVCLPSVRRVQWHALYVASSPTAANQSITLYIKSRGRWSQNVHAHATLCRVKKCVPLVFLDGFYGHHAMDRVLAASFVLLIAVGDIHAPYILSIFQELVARYTQTHSLPGGELQKVVLVWSTDNLCFMKEMEPMLRVLQRLDPHGDVLRVQLHLTRQPCEEDAELFTDRTPLMSFATAQFAASRVDKDKNPPHAFHRALQTSRVYVVGAKLVMCGALALLLYIAKCQASATHDAWVVVRLVEVGMVLVACCTTYLLVLVERRMIAIVLSGDDHHHHDTTTSTMEDQQKDTSAAKMVANGFDVIGTYEYESGLGFLEEYHVQVNGPPPVYAQLVYEMCNKKHNNPRCTSSSPISIEIAAPAENVAAITSDLAHAKDAQKMQIHVEHMRV